MTLVIKWLKKAILYRRSNSLSSKINYKTCIKFREIDTSLLLVRRSDKPFSETFDDFGLRADAIIPPDIPNLSLNILGGKFKSEDIKYKQLRDASLPWKGERINIWPLLDSVSISPIFTPIYFLFNEIDNVIFPYKLPKEILKNDKLKSEQLKLLGYNIDVSTEVKGYTQVVHSPTRLNYWHVELTLNQFDESLITRKQTQKSTWARDAATTLLDIISVKAFCKIKIPTKEYKINKKYYFK